MTGILMCKVRKGIITIVDDTRTLEFVNHRVKAYTPNNVIYRGKKCRPVNFYLKDGRWNPEMSEKRKEKISRLNIQSIKDAAINYIQNKKRFK